MARQPDATVYAKTGSERDSKLTRIGAAWSGEKGYTCAIEAVPVEWLKPDGRPLVLQIVENRKDGKR